MATLITLDQAKYQLRIVAGDTSQDADITRLMDAAEAIVLDYIAKSQAGRDLILTWTDPATVPKHVQHAILYQVTELDQYRGDIPLERTAGADLSDVVIGLLRRVSDPVLA
jgi:hypothetical protein